MIGKSVTRIVSAAVLLAAGILRPGYSTQAAFEPHEERPTVIDSVDVDSAAGAAYMVKDINPAGGIIYSYETNFENIEFNGQFIFIANDGANGEELWRSDGTAAGTEMIKDIYTGETGSFPGNLVSFNNSIYFRATSDEHDSELWKSDGTAAGTVLVKDIHPDYGSYPNDLTEFNGYLYFSATDGEHGEEMWRSDGTGAGTELFKDINLTGDSMPYWLTPFGDHLYFFADDGVNGLELWKSDGSAAGTEMVKNRDTSGWKMDNLTVYEDALYYITYEDGLHDGLWKSDGTESGTEKIMDIGVTEDPPIWRGNAWLQSVGDYLFFCNMTESYGYEYWISDGTASGSEMLKDIYPGENSGCYGFSYLPSEIAFHDGEYLLSAMDGLYGWELWISDGTELGTGMVKNIHPSGSGTAKGFYPGEYISLNELIFSADGGNFGDELWKTDGTETGTVLMQDIASGSNSSDPKGMTLVGDKLFFFANDNEHDYELWVLPLISMSDVNLIGETEGELGVEYSFDADVTPSNALTPVTYLWTATDQVGVRHSGSLSDSVSFSWNSAGEKTVLVTASNAVNSVEAELTIVIGEEDIALETLTLSGGEDCVVSAECEFTADITPLGAATPVTFEWQASDLGDVTNKGGLTDTVKFTWDTPGTKTVSVTANNGVNEMSKQVEIEISEKLSEIYLPIVVGN